MTFVYRLDLLIALIVIMLLMLIIFIAIPNLILRLIRRFRHRSDLVFFEFDLDVVNTENPSDFSKSRYDSSTTFCQIESPRKSPTFHLIEEQAEISPEEQAETQSEEQAEAEPKEQAEISPEEEETAF